MAERQFHIIPVELYRPGFFSMTLVTHSIKKIFKYAYVHLNLKPSSLVLSITTTIFFGARLQISSLHTYASIWQKNGKVKYRGFFLCQSRNLFDHGSTSKLWISLDAVNISLNHASAMSRYNVVSRSVNGLQKIS